MPGEIGSSSRLAQAPTRAARMKTVVVLGASYGGISAVRVLTQTLPKDWRIILIDRNSHANHLYVFPRFAVVSGHEHKAFIPLTGVFGPQSHPHRFIHGTVTGLSAHSVTVAPALPDEHTGLHDDVQEDVAGPSCVAFDYAIYALGSKLPAPIDLWSKPEDPEHKASEHDNDEDVIVPARKIGTKVEGVSWLQASQERIAKAPSVLVVGGGALGIRMYLLPRHIYPGLSCCAYYQSSPRTSSHDTPVLK
jgi:NADH dehydrogenase FAD-containing subunit